MSQSLSWETIQPPKKKPRAPSAKRKTTNRGKTVAINDIRQKQHIRPRSFNSLAAPDPWTQLTSLASHVASFIPPHEPSFFLSFFHNPAFSSPSAALRAAMTSIAQSIPEAPKTDILFGVLDILRSNPLYDTLTSEQKSFLVSDAQLALTVTSGRGEDALDLVWLLHQLDDDSENTLEMGVYHNTPTIPNTPSWPSSPTAPPSIIIPPTNTPLRSAETPSPVTSKSRQNSSQWQSVPVRKQPQPYPHASYIPVSNPSTARRPAAGGNGFGKGDVGELSLGRTQMMRERNELLRQAAGAWKSGSKNNRGGEVAAYFADRARQVQENVRKEQLERARDMVERKRISSQTGDSVDLHGTSVAEAIVIVKDILKRDGCTPAKPLNIITGRGTHSANRVGVLKPAVKSALVEDGWHVGAWDGGLVVKGKQGIYAR